MDMNMYLTTPLQLDKVCRACLTEKGDMKPLFGACLDEMLRSFADVKIEHDDGLPNLMCVQCVLQCSRAYTFKQQCEKSESILRTYVSPEFQAQLCESLEEQQKRDLDAQFEFTETIVSDVVISNELPADFVGVNYTVTDTLDDKPDDDEHYYTMQSVEVKDESGVVIGIAQLSDIDAASSSQEEVSVLVEPLHDTMIADSTADAELNTTHKDRKYRCKKCHESFNLMVDLKVHMMSHPKDLTHVCHVCDKAFAEARILKRHSKIHLAKKPHQCDQCDMSFAESSNLSKHKKKHTGELRNIKGKPHLCSVCGRAFKWASSLSKHMKYHTGHKLLTCHYCAKQYVEARSLRIHIRSHTGERPHVCTVCKKSFTQVCNLEKHMRVHTGEKPFLCPVCGKGFTQSGYVSIHLRTHTGERPYVCSTCGKAFAGSNTLAIHQRIHTGEKPYVCNFCDKRFSRQEALIIHTRTHTGIKPHVCSVCNRAFTSSSHLSSHMRTHTGEKPHECSVCLKRFSGSGSLKVHMRIHADSVFVDESSLPPPLLADHGGEKVDICKLEAVQIATILSGDAVHSVQVQAINS